MKINHKGLSMRFLLLPLLLIACNLGYAASNPLYACWDGSKWTGSDSSVCPAQLSNATGGSNVSDTTSGVTVETDKDGGTIYAYAKATSSPGVCPADPTYAQMLSGSGAAASGSDATVTAGQTQISLTGLSASTEYCVWFLHVDAKGRPSSRNATTAAYIVESSPWETLAAAPDPNDLETTNARFVGTGGTNDANCGTTHSDRCLTTAGLSTPLSAGTDVYLLAGTDNGKRQFTINWSGSSTDRVIIGCYYMDAGTATSCNEGSGAGAQTKPLIRGTYEDSCRVGATPSVPSTCPVDTASAIPSNSSQGLIYAVQQQYLTIQDLRIEDSSGAGIWIDDVHVTPNNDIIQRVDITQTYWHGIRIYQVADESKSIIRDNTVSYAALSYVDGRYGNWPQCINIRGNATETLVREVRSLIENNTVSQCGGEGISVNRSSHHVVRGNRVGNNRRPMYRVDNASDVVFEHNIAAGGGYSANGYTDDNGHCFASAVEDYASSKNVERVIFRNNICTGSQRGFTLLMDSAAQAAGKLISTELYGNTFALTNASSYFLASGGVPSANIGSITIKGNLVTGNATCSWSNYGAKDTVDYNAFSTSIGSNCLGTNSSVGSTGITLETWTSSNWPSVADVTPTGVGLDDGVSLTSAALDIADFPNWSEHSADICDPSEANWEKTLGVDYSCTARGATPDAGAVEVP